jgi:hypothetical protein
VNDSPLNRPAQSEAPAATPGFALWNLGFRPFYLLASIFSAIGVLLWAAQFSGYLPSAYLQGPVWHGHEMLFGYTIAVIAGFLLTAVRAWTNEPTPHGVPLMGLAALWVCGRVLVLTSFGMAAAVVNAAFPVAVAVAIGIPLLRSRNVHNYFFVGLLVLLGMLILAVHLALQDRFELSPRLGLQLALDVVLFIMVVMGGRVIPMFTNNGVPGTNATRHSLVEKFALGSVLLLFAADLLQLPQTIIAMIAMIGARCAPISLEAVAHPCCPAGVDTSCSLRVDSPVPRAARPICTGTAGRIVCHPRAHRGRDWRIDAWHDDPNRPGPYRATPDSRWFRTYRVSADTSRCGCSRLRRYRVAWAVYGKCSAFGTAVGCGVRSLRGTVLARTDASPT